MKVPTERSLPSGIPATGTERERSLLQALDSALDPHQRAGALWGLMQFYLHHARRRDLAIALLDLMRHESVSPERTAIYCVASGRVEELDEHWSSALAHYECGLSFHPKNTRTVYLLYNGLALCHNRLAQYEEGESYCRRAIEIDGISHHAYVNLGIALEGRTDIVGAAFSFVEAIHANPEDPLPAQLLKKLLSDYPELLGARPWIDGDLGKCGSGAKHMLEGQKNGRTDYDLVGTS